MSKSSPSHEGTRTNETRARRGKSPDTLPGKFQEERQLNNGFIDSLTASLRLVPMPRKGHQAHFQPTVPRIIPCRQTSLTQIVTPHINVLTYILTLQTIDKRTNVLRTDVDNA